MKPKTSYLRQTAFSAAAITLIAGPFSQAAQTTTLLLDNFNTARLGDGNFNLDIAADQSGTAATKTYTTSLGGGWDGAYQRGNGGTWLMYAGASGFGSTNMKGSLNYDIAAEANTLSSALQISFNMSVSNSINETAEWTSFTIGGVNPFVNEASVGFSSLFRDNGGTQQFSNGSEIGSSANFTDGQVITFVLSDAAGTGSAFTSNGATDVVKMYVNGSLTNTWANLNLDTADQYISFNANSTVAQIDNLNISNQINGWTQNDVTDESFTNINYDAVSIFEWDLDANKDTDNGTRGTDYDAVSVSGALTISDNAIFKVIQNAGLDFNDTFWDTNQAWSDIFTSGSLTGGWATNTAVSVYDTSGGSVDVSSYGSFTISGTTLNWTAVPEPTSALAGLLITAGLLRRRR